MKKEDFNEEVDSEEEGEEKPGKPIIRSVNNASKNESWVDIIKKEKKEKEIRQTKKEDIYEKQMKERNERIEQERRKRNDEERREEMNKQLEERRKKIMEERQAKEKLPENEKESRQEKRSYEEIKDKDESEREKKRLDRYKNEEKPIKVTGRFFEPWRRIETDRNIDCPPHACFKCWELGHYEKDCKKQNNIPYCYNCGRRGRLRKNCERCGWDVKESEKKEKEEVWNRLDN